MPAKQIIVIGGGASGFFSAITIAEKHPDYTVTILEKSNKVLSKVSVSGGGRCNVTNFTFDINDLVNNYPRGARELKQVFSRFNVAHTISWFKEHGVKLKTEDDKRMFPVTDRSETIITCFLNEVNKLGIRIHLQEEVMDLISLENKQIEIITNKNKYLADSVICAMGGHNQKRNYSFLEKSGHTIVQLIPSLFTINLAKDRITELMGLSMKNVTISIARTKYKFEGPLLITHWGFSGPAVLKLSAFAAQEFYDLDYNAKILINWTGTLTEEQVRKELQIILESKALISNQPLFDIPKRLWEYLISKSEIPLDRKANEVGKRQINKLTQILTSDMYKMQGKTTFKEEFVTCGGVKLKEIDFKTMQSKIVPNLFFCGEVLDIDGITGGFNFQNAWSTAWVAASSVD